MKLCQHCERRQASRPWGLCRACYALPDIQAAYGEPVPSCTECGGKLAWNPIQRDGDLCAACKGTQHIAVATRAKLRKVNQLLLTGLVGIGPCSGEPGTVLKIAVLCLRAAQRLPLWHPGDRTAFVPSWLSR